MDAVKRTIAENFGGIAANAAQPLDRFDIDKDVPRLDGKVALTTGGSQGIGYAASFVMLRAGLAKLFILSTDQKVANGAINDITEKLGSEYARKVEWIQADLSDWPRAAQIAKEVSSKTDRLDILLLNAARGIMSQEITDYGVDRHMAVNHVGHVTLCSHLLPLLKKTAEKDTVRIQIQSSNAHQSAPKETKFANTEEINTDAGPMGLYGRAKLASLLYARYLNRHLHATHKNILINATHPGFVETKMSVDDIHEPYPIMGYGMSVGMQPFKKDQWEGSASTLFAATATKTSGEYICPPAIIEAGSELANSEELSENLMKWTRDVVKEKFSAQSVEKGCPLKDY